MIKEKRRLAAQLGRVEGVGMTRRISTSLGSLLLVTNVPKITNRA